MNTTETTNPTLPIHNVHETNKRNGGSAVDVFRGTECLRTVIAGQTAKVAGIIAGACNQAATEAARTATVRTIIELHEGRKCIKKDFVQVANMLRAVRPTSAEIELVADMFDRTNPAFNRNTFYGAAGW